MLSWTISLFLLTFGSVNYRMRPPNCLYEAYGCVYYIWEFEDGTGEALVTCDSGGTFHSYSGRFGDCPW